MLPEIICDTKEN